MCVAFVLRTINGTVTGLLMSYGLESVSPLRDEDVEIFINRDQD